MIQSERVAVRGKRMKVSFLGVMLAPLMVVVAATTAVNLSDAPPAHANTISTLVTKRASGSVAATFTLTAGQYIVSHDVRYALVMQSDGNLVLYGTNLAASSVPLWATGTNGRGAVRATFQGDGNLVLYRSDNRPVWASNTYGSGAAVLSVGDDGNVVLIRGDGGVVWQTGTGGRPLISYFGSDQMFPNQHMPRNTYMRSADGRYALLFQNDSNLVLYGPAYQVLWASNTNNSGAADLVLQLDGNVVLYRPDGSAVWDTHTWGFSINRFQVQNDAQAGAWAGTTFVWSTKSGLMATRPNPTTPQSTVYTDIAGNRFGTLIGGQETKVIWSWGASNTAFLATINLPADKVGWIRCYGAAQPAKHDIHYGEAVNVTFVVLIYSDCWMYSPVTASFRLDIQ